MPMLRITWQFYWEYIWLSTLKKELEMDDKWNAASIRIFSRSMSPQEISEALNSEPTHSHKKGDPVSKRNPEGAKRNENLWVLESGIDSSEPLDGHIEKLVEIIERKLDAFKILLQKCEIDIFCGFSSENGQGGFVITSDLMKRLTIIPIDIVLDLYPHECD